MTTTTPDDVRAATPDPVADRRPPRRWGRIALWTGVGLAIGVRLWFDLSMLDAAGDMADGGRALRASLAQAQASLTAGDFAGAQAQVTQARASMDEIIAAAGRPPVRALLSVPGAGQARDNVDHLIGAADDVTEASAEVVGLYGSLAGKNGEERIFADGRIDVERLAALGPVIDSIDDDLGSAEDQLQAVQGDGPLSGPLMSVRDAGLEQIVPVRDTLGAVQPLLPLLPEALGANGPRRYLIAIGNQAEMRASGGAPLSLAMIELVNGRFSIVVKGQTSTELFPPLNAPVRWRGFPPNPFFDDQPRNAPFVVADTHPDFRVSAVEMARAWAAGGYPSVNGVIALDMTAIQAVLRVTGPLVSEAYGTVTADTIGQQLLVDAYIEKGGDPVARQAANQRIVDDLIARITGGDQIVAIAGAIASTAPGRHFQVWLQQQDLQRLALSEGFAGALRPPVEGDWLALFTQNGNQSKVDVFQQRRVDVDVQLAADGSAAVTQRMTVVNATPADRPDVPFDGKDIGYGTNWLQAAYIAYVPDAARDVDLTIPDGFRDYGFPGFKERRGLADDGLGRRIARIIGWTEPAGQATVEVSYRLPPGTFTESDGSLLYTLRAEPQSIWQPATLTVRIGGPTGWNPVPTEGVTSQGSAVVYTGVQDRTLDVAVEFRR